MNENKIITIVQDTRQKIGKDQHVLDYLIKNNVHIIRSKLFVGDYALLHDMRVSIDRKMNMLEIANCICNSEEHERFKTELLNAQENGIKLFILIEDEYIYNLDGVKYFRCPTYKSNGWKNGIFHRKGQKMSQVNFDALGKAMKTMEKKYGCKFCFAKREEYGKKLLEILVNGCIEEKKEVNKRWQKV